MTIEPRPKRFPPPEFPPQRARLFARTTPAVFPSILGLLGLASALRLALARLGWDPGPGDLAAGLAAALWGFAAVAYGTKIARRPGVVPEDLRVLPGRAGLATMTMGGMAAAGLLAAYSATAGSVLLVLALAGHAVQALLLLRLLSGLPPETRTVNPTLHLSIVGFIVAAPPALALGWTAMAEALFWAVMPVAAGIWVLSLRQFVSSVPPAPLRPFLAIHLAPAALLALVGGLLGRVELAAVFLGLGTVYGLVLLAGVRWVTQAGPSPLWGSFTFPRAALASAMRGAGGAWLWPGILVLVMALGLIPAIAWWVLKRWPGGRLAAVTNASAA
jgi:tellurite resistance protein